jgi:hypothetical protein
MISTKCSDPWLLEFVISSIIGNSQKETVWPFSVYPLAVLVFVLVPITASDHLLYIVKPFLGNSQKEKQMSSDFNF